MVDRILRSGRTLTSARRERSVDAPAGAFAEPNLPRADDHGAPQQDDLDARVRALVIRANEYGVDPFGMSRKHVAIAVRIARLLYRDYFRTETFGIEHVPASGRVVLVANHSGQLPFDAVCIGAATFFEAKQPRLVRAMVEHFVPTMPYVSYLMSRFGQITGTPENCRRLLEQEEAILVFPEGARGIAKPFSRRYQLGPFGQGFLRLALETGAPIVPVAVIGAEEQAPTINLRLLARLLGTPSLPMLPFPPFVPWPLPVKYRIYFGAPMHFAGTGDEDDELVDEHVRAVRNRIQSMIHVGLRARRHIFW
ncbi:MAG TPA: lysophospholipid acyltransferase family protein [Kofleriaceae bacterium]|nr:lysophospholipid acyltransferase family protein [Kofleriaceae bacterium]